MPSPAIAVLACVLACVLVMAAPAHAGTGTAEPAEPQPETLPAHTRNGLAVYQAFRQGLADSECEPGASKRWQKHFAHAPVQLARSENEALPLLGYVVEALHEARLPTEYALIPLVESGYKPGARSPAGPAGLWQMIARTARHHRVPIGPGYDGRLSPVDSTRAAVRYLKTLHGMFGGNWQLVAMAYNAGEHRILGAVKRSGRKAAAVDPSALTGIADITRAYPRKLHALSCLLEQADDRERWREAMDRDVPRLVEVTLPTDATDLGQWARAQGHDPALLARLNPAHATGPLRGRERRILAPAVDASAADGGK
ncbi:lytic transglycosylase domain-containing protein [Aerolutibacter ruishenii]|nr:lytic transglycosylase domain-containing protein [Lysobacter ruishenii]